MIQVIHISTRACSFKIVLKIHVGFHNLQASAFSWSDLITRLTTNISSSAPPTTSEPILDEVDVLEADAQEGFWKDIYMRAVEKYGPVNEPYYEVEPWSVRSVLFGAVDSLVSFAPQWARDIWFYGPSKKELFLPEIIPTGQYNVKLDAGADQCSFENQLKPNQNRTKQKRDKYEDMR